jgi:GGDEF domain-containing protein
MQTPALTPDSSLRRVGPRRIGPPHVSLRPLNPPASELGRQILEAVLSDNDPQLEGALRELVRARGLSSRQRASLQLRELRRLLQALQRANLSDEHSGLCNRRGFLQAGTRLLDLAARDRQAIELVCFELSGLEEIRGKGGAHLEHAIVCELGNLMRDLFPNYGVYEVLGRLARAEFAALTPCLDYSARRPHLFSDAGWQMLHLRDCPAVLLNIGFAQFDPARPVGLNELVQSARHSMAAASMPGAAAPAAG